MKKLFLLTIMVLVLATMALAQVAPLEQIAECEKTSTCDVKFENTCQEFYGDSRYYTIAAWAYNTENQEYVSVHENKIYRYFDVYAEGTQNQVKWKSDYKIKSVVVVTQDSSKEMGGQRLGTIESDENIKYLSFCGKKSSKKSTTESMCVGAGCSSSNDSNGVPVFPGLAAGAAILVVTLGLIFIRRN